jgi:two-component system NtrC family sensor kinase
MVIFQKLKKSKTKIFFFPKDTALVSFSFKAHTIVSVSTKKLDNKVEVKVRDNGSGIPQKVLDKIFQPFFTTKPTGQGTGLGLSLSYDIITKEHGGTIRVETEEGEGAEFIIQLPDK